MNGYWKIPLSVTVRAPWVVPGDSPPGPEIDVALAKNQNGVYVLPPTFIKGMLRGALETIIGEGLGVASKLKYILHGGFGLKSGGETPSDAWGVDNQPARGYLNFSELTLQSDLPNNPNQTRTQRVQIDPVLGAAVDGHLLFVECPFSFGQEVTFSGMILASIPVCEGLVEGLQLAADRVFALGGMKSAGFGRVVKWEVGQAEQLVFAQAKPAATRLRLRYRLDRPFLVDSQRHTGNLMIGSDIIPGGAIKGCIAQQISHVGEADNFGSFLSALNISHAHPAKPESTTLRPVLPLSLSVESEKVFCHLTGENKAGFHRFQPDWKDANFAKVRAYLTGEDAYPDPKKTGASRTAINPETLGALYENTDGGAEGTGALFAYVSVKSEKHEWLGTMISDDAEKLGQVLGMLQAGVPGLGKTGAVLSAEWEETTPRELPETTLNLCLQSDACLLPPDISASTSLFDAYKKYFAEHGLTLKAFFAEQTLRGGYQALRYPASKEGYQPWLLTKAGSVFRLEVGVNAPVAELLANGLPPSKDFSTDWRAFPFLRENGYGHVLHNAVDHTALKGGVVL